MNSKFTRLTIPEVAVTTRSARIVGVLQSKEDQRVHISQQNMWVMHSRIGGLDPEITDLLIKIELKLWRGIRPDCIFQMRRNRPESSEHSLENWKRLVSLYDDIRYLSADRFRIVDIDNNRDVDESMKAILEAIAI